MKTKRVLALDPSSVETGYAIISNHNGDLKCEQYGSIEIPKSHELGRRLHNTRERINGLILMNKPDVVVCEDQFGGKNQKTLMTLREIVGVIRQVCYEHGITEDDFHMYAPSTIKKSVTGHGKSAKDRVKKKVEERFNLPDIDNDNITDAIGVGITYFDLN